MLLMQLTEQDFDSKMQSFRSNNFTREGRAIVWDYLESINEARELAGKPNLVINLTKIACSFQERSLEQFARENDISVSSDDETELYRAIMDFLNKEDRLISFCEESGNVVYIRAGLSESELFALS